MRALSSRMTAGWQRLGSGFLPFADAASESLPLARLLRLSLFQVSVAMAAVLLTGTLNRVTDRRDARVGGPRLLHGRAAAPVRAVARAGRVQVGHTPVRARLAARALHLVRDAAAVRRPCHHAVRAADPVGRHARPDLDRHRGSGVCVPARRRRHAHRRRPRASRWRRISPRTRRGRAWWRCSTSCCWSARRQARCCTACCWRTSPRCG